MHEFVLLWPDDVYNTARILCGAVTPKVSPFTTCTLHLHPFVAFNAEAVLLSTPVHAHNFVLCADIVYNAACILSGLAASKVGPLCCWDTATEGLPLVVTRPRQAAHSQYHHDETTLFLLPTLRLIKLFNCMCRQPVWPRPRLWWSVRPVRLWGPVRPQVRLW